MQPDTTFFATSFRFTGPGRSCERSFRTPGLVPRTISRHIPEKMVRAAPVGVLIGL
jgi:hypothetical protein